MSNIGRVRNTESGRIMKLQTSRAGYHVLNLYMNGNRTNRKVHRLVACEFIPNPSNKTTVDHIDSKAILNNNVENLRWATRKDQQGNTSKRLNTSSKYKGVYWYKARSKWCSRIYIDGKQICLGMYQSEEEAGLSYNKAAIEYFGEFANLNVIEHIVAP